MAKGKRNAKLRVIQGGAAPKAVLSGGARTAASGASSAAGGVAPVRAGAPNAPRPTPRGEHGARPGDERDERDERDRQEAIARASAVTARSSRVSRGAILVGLAVALAFGAWALTRNSLPKAESTAATRPVAPTVVPSAPAASAAPSP